MQEIQTHIEQRLRQEEPQVEVLLVEQVAAEKLRLFIDHPDGVSLELCERVTHRLRDVVLERYALEVSSPGPERPLTRPEHFNRYLGKRARVRTLEPQGGRKSFTGELVGTTDETVTVAADDGVVSIPYAAIQRSHLLED